MDAVSNINQVMLILRQKLQERARKGATSSTSKSAPSLQDTTRSDDVDPMRRIADLARDDGLEDQQLARLFIESLLTREFGSALSNDAQFQQVIERVMQSLSSDTQLAAILNTAIIDIKNDRLGKKSSR
jgi:hypothetical protein